MTAKEADGMEEFCLPEETMMSHSGKFLRLFEILRELKQQNSKVLLFSQMTKVLDICEEFLRWKGYSCIKLDGRTGGEERQCLIDQFQEDPSIFIFLLSTRAGGQGINLTAADTVIFLDISYNYQVDKQAEDRCHRIGQTKDVRIIRLIMKDTVEENILKLSLEKKRLSDVIMEEGEEEEGKKGGRGGKKKKKAKSVHSLSAHEAKKLLYDALSQRAK